MVLMNLQSVCILLLWLVSIGVGQGPTGVPSSTRPPSLNPTKRPTINPLGLPSFNPSDPTKRPTINSLGLPSFSPSNPTKRPTINSLRLPSFNPTKSPTKPPTNVPCNNSASSVYCEDYKTGSFCQYNQDNCALSCGICEGAPWIPIPPITHMEYCAMIAGNGWESLSQFEGLLNGGTLILVQSRCFASNRTNAAYWLPYLNVACNFGNIPVPASYLYSGTFACLSPPSKKFTSVSFSVSINGIVLPQQGPPRNFSYVKMKSADLENARNGVIFEDGLLWSRREANQVILNFTAVFSPMADPYLYVYYMIYSYGTINSRPSIVAVNNGVAIENKGTYTTAIPNLSSSPTCQQIMYFVTNYKIGNTSAVPFPSYSRRLVQSLPALGSYCQTSCKNGEMESVLSCGAEARDYDNWITYLKKAIDSWGSYTIDGKRVLSSYSFDNTKGVIGIGWCVQGCYSSLSRGREIVKTKKYFDAHAQCEIIESNADSEKIKNITRNYQNALYGVDATLNKSVTTINDCIKHCVNLARIEKLVLGLPTKSPTMSPTRNPTTAKPTMNPTAKPTTAKPTTAKPTTTAAPTSEITISCGNSVSAKMGSAKNSQKVIFKLTRSYNWITFDMCDSTFDTKFSGKIGSNTFSSSDSSYCRNTKLPYSKIKSVSSGTGYITIAYESGTPGKWTLKMTCSILGRRRLLSEGQQNENKRQLLPSTLTHKTFSTIAISVISNSDCKPVNWQKETAQPGLIQGDPHITQFDLAKYSFQGKGSYLLYKLDAFEIHGLFMPRPLGSFRALFSSPATFVMAFAVVVKGTVDNGDVIVVYANDKSENADISAYFNCALLPNNENQWYYRSRFRYIFTTDHSIRMEFYNAISLTYTTNGWQLMAYVPQFLLGASAPISLLGDYNGDLYTLDNFNIPLLSNFTNPLPCPYPLFNRHCRTWQYKTLVLPVAFCNCNHGWVAGEGLLLCPKKRQRVLLETVNTSMIDNSTYNTTDEFNITQLNSTEQAWVESICGTDSTCIYDLVSTGDESLAQQTKQANIAFNETLDTIANTYECYPPCVNNGTCVADNQCACQGEFSGSRCEQNTSLPAYSAVVLASLLTAQPSTSPTLSPTQSPTNPTLSPSHSPTLPTTNPSPSPTYSPTLPPTMAPTYSPSRSPSQTPTNFPTRSPSQTPTNFPTRSPSTSPTTHPTVSAAVMLRTTSGIGGIVAGFVAFVVIALLLFALLFKKTAAAATTATTATTTATTHHQTLDQVQPTQEKPQTSTFDSPPAPASTTTLPTDTTFVSLEGYLPDRTP